MAAMTAYAIAIPTTTVATVEFATKRQLSVQPYSSEPKIATFTASLKASTIASHCYCFTSWHWC